MADPKPKPPPKPKKKSSPTTTVPKRQSNTLADLKAQYGDGPAALAALNQGLISTDDPDDLDVLLSRAEGIGLLETAKSSQLLSDFYNTTKIKKRFGVDLVELQQRMYLAGLYGSADIEDINLGTPDALSARAFASLLDMAGRMNQAGSKMTLNEVLGSSMNAGIKSGRSMSGGRGAAKTRPSVDLPGPEEIAQAVKATMSDLLGREPDAAELESLASVLTTFSKESATERQSLAVAPDGTQQVVSDPAARFKEYLSANYRPEVARRRDVGELASGRDNLLKAVLGIDQMMGA